MDNENMNVEEQQAPQLGLRDIATMVNLIDLVSRRGGFEGPELEAVGGLRTRVVKFLEAAQEAQGTEGVEGDLNPVEDVEVVEAEGSAD
jgi:hypothetical protein